MLYTLRNRVVNLENRVENYNFAVRLQMTVANAGCKVNILFYKNQRKMTAKYDLKTIRLSLFAKALKDASAELRQVPDFNERSLTMKKYYFCIRLDITLPWLENLLKQSNLKIAEDGQIISGTDTEGSESSA